MTQLPCGGAFLQQILLAPLQSLTSVETIGTHNLDEIPDENKRRSLLEAEARVFYNNTKVIS